MITLGEFRSDASTVEKEGEMILIDHFWRDNRYGRGRVNCDVGEEMGYEYDNGDYHDGEWGNCDYQGDRHQSQVNCAENENDYSPNRDSIRDTGDRNTDSEMAGYLSNLGAAREYRDAGRPVGCDVLKRSR